jgi:hypothetical protein
MSHYRYRAENGGFPDVGRKKKERHAIPSLFLFAVATM